MKFLRSIPILMATATLGLHAGHVPEKVMHHYCTEVASAQYNVPLQQIEAHMPVYKKKGFIVRGKMRRNGHFVCRFDAYGKFQFIKQQAPKPQNSLKKRIRRVCKSEASVRWHTPKQDIKITEIRKIAPYRYQVTMEDAYNTGTCEVNRDGYVSRFQTLSKSRQVPRSVTHACKRKAASRWNVPMPYIQVDNATYMGRGRYAVEVSSDELVAHCEVRQNGIIEHFNTQQRRRRW